MSEEEELVYNQDPLNEEDTGGAVLLDDMTVSLNALSGNTNINTLRIRGTVNNKEIQILIDNGSTHCFLDEDTTLQLGCTMEATIPMMVSVADGSKMVSRTIMPDFTWTIQGHKFSYPIRIIKLGGYDMVLGGDWLRLNSPVEFDYHKMKVTISRNWKKIIMKAMTDTGQLKMISTEGLDKLLMKIRYNLVGQLFSVTVTPVSSEVHHPDLAQVLTSYQVCFL
ncbi:hypothetical protein BUALT_Bualt03G0114300 [Buddleja alternifolia]|uniref:Uncharacterized protein n=1 Tax=Buddleja alternifolia TaxID=168488 RepID=A0AAV6Y093_9LAMI|nr:hypothetical protein BUALT_Bualt03G0114300 [Buddleja alternifolia]